MVFPHTIAEFRNLAPTKDNCKIPTKLHGAGSGPEEANWKPAAQVCLVSLAGWGKPVSLDSWPGYIIPCFQQNPMGKPCANPKDVICIKWDSRDHPVFFVEVFSMELHKNRLTGGRRALPELVDYQARRKHPVTARSAVLEDSSWRK